jgi:hypothetical protein
LTFCTNKSVDHAVEKAKCFSIFSWECKLIMCTRVLGKPWRYIEGTFFLLLLKLLPNIYTEKKPRNESRVLFSLFISFSTCIHKSNNCSRDIYIRAQKLCEKMLAFLHHFKFEFIFLSLFYHFLGFSFFFLLL